jgi:hypothetical protein
MKKPSVVTLGLLKSRDYILGESSCAFVDEAECLAGAEARLDLSVAADRPIREAVGHESTKQFHHQRLRLGHDFW